MRMLGPTGTLDPTFVVSMRGRLASHTRFMYTRVVRMVLTAHMSLFIGNRQAPTQEMVARKETHWVPRLKLLSGWVRY